jgi:hypothetical protein
MHLCCTTDDLPRAWVDWLPWIEYCYNTPFHVALHTTSFKVVYGWAPPPLLLHTLGAAQTEASKALLDCDAFLNEVCQHLLQAQ